MLAVPQEVFLPRQIKNKGTRSAGTREKCPEAAPVAMEGRMGTRDAGKGDYNSQKAARAGDPCSFPLRQRSRRRTPRGEIPSSLSFGGAWASPGALPARSFCLAPPGFVWLHPSPGSSLGQPCFRSARLRPPHNARPGPLRGGAVEDAPEEGDASAHLRDRPGKRVRPPALPASLEPGQGHSHPLRPGSALFLPGDRGDGSNGWIWMQRI